MSGILGYLLPILLFFTAVFLILLVLVQRGKGGGLAGAFGGLGGQSAFGTKAGDLFTRVTIGVATFWIVLCMITVKFLGTGEVVDPTLGGDDRPAETFTAPQTEDGEPGDSSSPESN